MFANMLRATQREYFNKLKKAKAAASPHKPTFADGARLPCAFPVHSINKEASRPRTLSSKPIAPNETMLRASLVLLALVAAHGLPTSHRPSAHATESGERRIANARALDAEVDALSHDLEIEEHAPEPTHVQTASFLELERKQRVFARAAAAQQCRLLRIACLQLAPAYAHSWHGTHGDEIKV